jgi:hypothetical protein
MTTKLQPPPAPLDNTRIHTREEYKAWQDAMFEYHAAIRAEEKRELLKAEVAKAEANRHLTDDEYHALAVQREAEKQARQAERDAEEAARAEAKAAYLASMPEVAEIQESNPFTFVKQICHWSALGYSLPENANVDFLPGLYSVSLDKPAATAKKTK